MENEKMKFIRGEFKVTRKIYLTEHYIRVYLTGEQVPLIQHTTIGINNKIAIPPKGVDKVYFPEFDMEKGEWTPLPEELRPTIRTYTHRGIDMDSNEIWIDFVAHGDEGPASAWAIAAQAGDVLGVMMKNDKLELYTPADNYLLVGDATAIPVLGAILEDLPATASGTCIIEVHAAADEQVLYSKAAIKFIWLHNPQPEKGSELARQVRAIALPTENRFAYVAAEFSSVKEIRNYLRKELDWQREELYAYSYWKSGVAEDKSVKARQNEKE